MKLAKGTKGSTMKLSGVKPPSEQITRRADQINQHCAIAETKSTVAGGMGRSTKSVMPKH